MGVKRWLNYAAGEISKLRVRNVFFNVNNLFSAPYTLDSQEHVDYKFARDLYYNRNDSYKLGAGFAKPIINTLAGFMGVPRFSCDDPDAQEQLDDFMSSIVSTQQRLQQKNLLDGECFVRLVNLDADGILYPESKTRLTCVLIPPEQIPVGGIEFDPVTRRYTAVTILGQNKWIDDSGNEQTYTFRQRITATDIKTDIVGTAPEGVVSKTEANSWGFIPIVHFKNEPDETELHGYSELEPIEPFLKAYHDVMMHAISGSKMHSTPKVKFKLDDVDAFLKNNFPTAYENIRAGKPAQIDMNGRELFLLKKEEDSGFIECSSAIGDAGSLLQLLFYCIVDTSEVPEFAFGVHISSSQASTKEQGPILVRRVARKREQVTEPWQLFARMALAMIAKTTGKKFKSYATTITWDAVMDRDEQEDANTLWLVVQAMNMALAGNFISLQAATEFLAKYVDTMQEWETDDPEIPGERERIMKTRLSNMRLEDSQFVQSQIDKIDQEVKVS
jgi:hypothetical protein